jgi:hypothetical protein
VHDDRRGVRGGLLDPECLELGKFLALGLAGVDRKPARREAILRAFCDSPEIARAKKNANFVVIVRLVNRGVKTKAPKTEIDARFRRRRVAKRKLTATPLATS